MSQKNNTLRDLLYGKTKEDIAYLLSDFSDEEIERIFYDWSIWARPEQMQPEGNWLTWLILAGRGFGKTRTGAEMIKQVVYGNKTKYITLIAPTAADCRDVMAEGESGIINVFRPQDRPKYSPSKRAIEFHNGARAIMFSAEDPESLRGSQAEFAWCDELCSWKYPETYDQLLYTMRLGSMPRKIITTTPKPTKLIKELLQDPTCHITRGSTLDNSSNLPQTFIQDLVNKYAGTRLGKQELYAEVLLDNQNALWKRDTLDKLRLPKNAFDQIDFRRIVVGVDPATTNSKDSDETGIIVAGIDSNGIGYVIEDLTMKGSPLEWAKVACDAYHKYQAERIVVEVNNGGDMVLATIRQINQSVPVKQVRASKSKHARAEPVSALYEQERVRHIGSFHRLEDQLCEYDPISYEKSPDRLDALVWALTDLIVENNGTGILDYYSQKLREINPEAFASKIEFLDSIFKNKKT